MRGRTLVLLIMASLVGAACGARLDDDQRAARVGGHGSDGEVAAAGPQSATVNGEVVEGEETADGGGLNGSGGSSGASAGGSQASSGGSRGGSASTAEKCRPGEATGVGVTPKEITIGVVSDITGPSPGLFKSTHQAVQAYASKVNSEGGICGRALKVLKLDARTESGGNRAAVLDACNKAFALVGSMSAFDDGGATAVDECGIPDMSAIVVNEPRIKAQHTFPMFPAASGLVSNGSAAYVAEQHPTAVKKAAILWLNAAATRNNARERIKAWETVGFDFVYEKEVQVLEANYTPYVQDMDNLGVQYVTMIADVNAQARLLKAAQQQRWTPEVWDFDSSIYDAGFPVLAGTAAEGINIFVNTAMFEDAGTNPEIATYLDWLGKTTPNAEPDYFGIYAWSAAALFTDLATKLGPDPTQAKLLEALKAQGPWDGRGIHGPHNIGQKTPGNCFLFMKVQNGAFARTYPSQGLDCDRGQLVKAR